MTHVACFCGCLFSFNDGAGACPKCGRVASVTAGPVLEHPEHNRPEHPGMTQAVRRAVAGG
jgi:hypothetical protein